MVTGSFLWTSQQKVNQETEVMWLQKQPITASLPTATGNFFFFCFSLYSTINNIFYGQDEVTKSHCVFSIRTSVWHHGMTSENIQQGALHHRSLCTKIPTTSAIFIKWSVLIIHNWTYRFTCWGPVSQIKASFGRKLTAN